MALPDPKPGLVVRYDYLWSHEAAKGRTQGKDRPACLMIATDPAVTPRFVVLLPITHSAPTGGTVGIEVPAAVRAHLGLDEQPCWVVISDHNIDEWPNPGLQPVPGDRDVFAYGFIPPRLFASIKAKFLELARTGRANRVKR